MYITTQDKDMFFKMMEYFYIYISHYEKGPFVIMLHESLLNKKRNIDLTNDIVLASYSKKEDAQKVFDNLSVAIANFGNTSLSIPKDNSVDIELWSREIEKELKRYEYPTVLIDTPKIQI